MLFLSLYYIHLKSWHPRLDDQLVQYSSGIVFCKWILSIKYDSEVTKFDHK